MWTLGESEISVYPVIIASPGMCHCEEAREDDVVVLTRTDSIVGAVYTNRT